MQKKKSFNEDDIKAFEPAEKIGLVASINPEGLPHISLITSIQTSTPTQIILGQFCKGLSKQHIQDNPNIGFLIMTLDKKMWKGKAKWAYLKEEGPELEMYNNIPMFRYNAYFGMNTVHYLDLIETTEKQDLPMPAIILAAILTGIAKGGAGTGIRERILKPVSEKIYNKLDSLTFISYVDNDGFPVIIPVIQCQAADSRRLVFSTRAFKDEISSIPEGASVAVFSATMNMENILIRGIFRGFRRHRFIKMGIIDIEWVYNSMPPCHGQIYPEVELKPVTEF